MEEEELVLALKASMDTASKEQAASTLFNYVLGDFTNL